MRCTDNSYRTSRSSRSRKRARARKRRKRLIRRMTFLLLVLCLLAAGVIYKKYNSKEEYLAAEYEASTYNTSIYRGSLYSADLCVVTDDIALDKSPDSSTLKTAALFNVDGKTTKYAYHVHDKMYPASLTKLMTALVTFDQIEQGKVSLEDSVTVSANADSTKFSYDEQTCGIKEGDTLTLEDLLYGLLVYSGNDNAVAIAEHVSGNIDDFATLMNEKAQEIHATNSHFVNPNGLHNEDHYTTAYDMYLIFNQCIKHDKFLEIIQTDSYKANVKEQSGGTRELTWEQTNYYALGEAKLPTTGKIIGGKTGTTLKAGNCLVLLDESDSGNRYISIVMGATTKEILYEDMTCVIEGISDAE